MQFALSACSAGCITLSWCMCCACALSWMVKQFSWLRTGPQWQAARQAASLTCCGGSRPCGRKHWLERAGSRRWENETEIIRPHRKRPTFSHLRERKIICSMGRCIVLHSRVLRAHFIKQDFATPQIPTALLVNCENNLFEPVFFIPIPSLLESYITKSCI